MSQLGPAHESVNEEGVGKCSVPMWWGEMPAGFCDEPAYGKPKESSYYYIDYAGNRRRGDGRYSGYVPALACPTHGGPRSRVFKDGNMWCAVWPDFTNIQESLVGFGETPEEARKELSKASGGKDAF